MVTLGWAGILRPGKLLWLRAIAWMMTLAVASVVLFNAVAKAALHLIGWAAGAEQQGGVSDSARLAAAILGVIALILFYRVAVRLGERRKADELSLAPLPFDLLAGAAIGAALMTLIVATLWLSGWVTVAVRPVEAVSLALRDSIRSGFVEEIVLRLIFFRLLWRAFGVWPAFAIAACLFGALHLGNPESSVFAAVSLICGEGVAIGLYLITGRIWASIGMHAAWNFAQGWIFGAVVSGTSEISGGPLVLAPVVTVPDLLSGGGFGPEASLAALVISLVGSGAVLAQAWTSGGFVAADQYRTGVQASG